MGKRDSTFLPFILISACSDKEVITRMGMLRAFGSFEDPQSQGIAVQMRLLEEAPVLPKGAPRGPHARLKEHHFPAFKTLTS